MSKEELEQLLHSDGLTDLPTSHYEFAPGRYCLCIGEQGRSTIFIASPNDLVQYYMASKILGRLRLPPITAKGELRDAEPT